MLNVISYNLVFLLLVEFTYISLVQHINLEHAQFVTCVSFQTLRKFSKDGSFQKCLIHGSHEELSPSNLNLLMVPIAQQDELLEGEAHMG